MAKVEIGVSQFYGQVDPRQPRGTDRNNNLFSRLVAGRQSRKKQLADLKHKKQKKTTKKTAAYTDHKLTKNRQV